MKILITGCRGQLGQALQAALKTYALVCVDMQELDITDPLAVEQRIHAEEPELVINAAAYTRVDDAETDIENAYRVNETGPRLLAQATQEIDATLLHVSTDYVFDGRSQRPWLESDQPSPLSVYGKSKLAGELAVQETHAKYFIVRTAWLYHFNGENFLRTMYRLSKHDEVRVVDDQRGSPTNADDLAEAIARLIKTQDYGIHHLVNAGAVTWYELTCEFYRQLGIVTKVVPVSSEEFPRPAPRPANSVLGTERNNAISLPDWREGISRLVQDISESPESWKPGV